ncbi:hypothetical protein T492DRAFT_1112961 [Pavlovales sp. CCMP2436]|nr:hypothetical protein T492DRAFT_1112961 [Pavlovales sp. CCMP2436]
MFPAGPSGPGAERAAERRARGIGKLLLEGTLFLNVSDVRAHEQMLPELSDRYTANLPRPQLPIGFEQRVHEASGKLFFVDHTRRSTTWTDPREQLARVRSMLPAGVDVHSTVKWSDDGAAEFPAGSRTTTLARPHDLAQLASFATVVVTPDDIDLTAADPVTITLVADGEAAAAAHQDTLVIISAVPAYAPANQQLGLPATDARAGDALTLELDASASCLVALPPTTARAGGLVRAKRAAAGSSAEPRAQAAAAAEAAASRARARVLSRAHARLLFAARARTLLEAPDTLLGQAAPVPESDFGARLNFRMRVLQRAVSEHVAVASRERADAAGAAGKAGAAAAAARARTPPRGSPPAGRARGTASSPNWLGGAVHAADSIRSRATNALGQTGAWPAGGGGAHAAAESADCVGGGGGAHGGSAHGGGHSMGHLAATLASLAAPGSLTEVITRLFIRQTSRLIRIAAALNGAPALCLREHVGSGAHAAGDELLLLTPLPPNSSHRLPPPALPRT